MRLSLLLLITSSACFSLSAQSGSKAFYERIIYASADSFDVFWDDPIVSAKFNARAVELLRTEPVNQYTHVLLRFHVRWSGFNTPASQELYDRLDSLVSSVDAQISQADKKWSHYNQFSAIHGQLSFIANRIGRYDLRDKQNKEQIRCSELAISYASKTEKIRGQTQYAMSLVKLTSAYNNYGTFVYQGTHHKDSKEKRYEVGPIIEKYLVKADSLSDLEWKESYAGSHCGDLDFGPAGNLVMLYGYYYPNELKAKLYREKVLELNKRCKDRVFWRDQAIVYLTGSDGWNEFSKQNYALAIKLLRRTLYDIDTTLQYHQYRPLAVQSLAQLKSDVRFALTESYYETKNTDSAKYYGQALLNDTTRHRDYAFLSSAASMLAELYLDSDIKTSKEYIRLSKLFMQKSQHEHSLNNYMKEGEVLMMKDVFKKINKLSLEIDKHEHQPTSILIWLTLLVVTFLGFLYFMLKLHQQGFFRFQRMGV